MEIFITSKMSSLTGQNGLQATQYDIYSDGSRTRYATYEFFKLRPTLTLYENTHGSTILQIKKPFSWFKEKYVVRFPNGKVIEYKSLDWWKIRDQFVFGSDIFDIYGHRERKYSIFKNGVQIAWWDKNKVVQNGVNEYTMIADNDSSYDLLIAFCLITNMSQGMSDSTVSTTYDMGNVGGEVQPFNVSWKPK